MRLDNVPDCADGLIIFVFLPYVLIKIKIILELKFNLLFKQIYSLMIFLYSHFSPQSNLIK